MVLEVKEITRENLNAMLNKTSCRQRKTLAPHFGKLKRGIDGLEYQKTVRNEWN